MKKDIERFLVDEPVQSHRESMVERTTRFTRKHRSLVNLTLAATGILAVGATIAALLINQALISERSMKIQLIEANEVAKNAKIAAVESETEAIKQLDRTQQVLEETRIVLDLFAELFSGPGACGLSENLTLLEGLEKLKSKIDDSMPASVQAMLYKVIALNLHGSLKPSEAIEAYDQAIDLADEQYGVGNRLALECRIGKAVVSQQAGRSAEAETLSRKLLLECEANPDENVHSLYHIHSVLAVIELERKKSKLAFEHIEKASRWVNVAFPDPANSHCLKINGTKIAILRSLKRLDDALELCDDSLRLAIESDQEKSMVGVRLLTEKARIELSRSKVDSENGLSVKTIEAGLQRAADIQAELYGPEHPNTRLIQYDVARVLATHPNSTKEEVDRSIVLLKELAAWIRAKMPKSKMLILKIEFELAKAIWLKGKAT